MPKVIYENPRLVAVEKPAGMLVHPTRAQRSTNNAQREGTLVDWLLERYPEIKNVGDLAHGGTGGASGPDMRPGHAPKTVRPGIVHRLDRATSGILVVARTQEAFEYLKSLFKKREIKKTYFALVWGLPRPERVGNGQGKFEKAEGVIDAPISLKPGTTRRTVHKGKETRQAETRYKIIAKYSKKQMKALATKKPKDEKGALLEVYPKTGRTHQIRVHLASIGHPVVGDRKYGRKWERSAYKQNDTAEHPAPSTPRLYLHAFSLQFIDADGTKLHLETERPEWASAIGANSQ